MYGPKSKAEVMKTSRLLDFPKILDPRGNLTFFEGLNQIPFKISRVFWTYDVPGGEIRGGHAFREQEEVIVALSGSFDVVISDSKGEIGRFNLNRSYYGLYLPPRTWRHMENFSTNSLSLHVCSSPYSTEDYIRDIKEV